MNLPEARQTPLPTLALFDVDHTLLDGDGDDLWCRFLVQHELAPAGMLERNARMGEDYRAGRVSVQDFSGFYAGLLAGRSPAFWAPWQQRFLDEEIRPRLPDAARAKVAWHRGAGHRVVLTTASNRVIAERTAAEFGADLLFATELVLIDGVYSGQVDGTPNMRDGKLQRLRAWLAGRGEDAGALATAWFYSDSINDLPLLAAVGRPVAVNPDPMLARHAATQGWPVEDLLGGPHGSLAST
jgi:HAD superfamily hydrolase (TIGR01490 family)